MAGTDIMMNFQTHTDKTYDRPRNIPLKLGVLFFPEDQTYL